MSKILIIEDEAKIARFVELELKHEGYEVSKEEDGRAGLDLALSEHFDLILLDIMLPGLNGIEVLRRLRMKKDTPVIMLTARDAVMDKVSGLDAGADDYITKPFAIEELLARIRVALKRKGAASAVQETKRLSIVKKENGDGAEHEVSLDVDRHEVTVDAEVVYLTNHEFLLLQTLLENKNIVMDREKLISRVCGYDYVGETNIIDVYVRYLRSKIDDRWNISLIRTVRGIGYVIRDDG
jgi:DNA-binding response OmpR family regulator